MLGCIRAAEPAAENHDSSLSRRGRVIVARVLSLRRVVGLVHGFLLPADRDARGSARESHRTVFQFRSTLAKVTVRLQTHESDFDRHQFSSMSPDPLPTCTVKPDVDGSANLAGN